TNSCFCKKSCRLAVIDWRLLCENSIASQQLARALLKPLSDYVTFLYLKKHVNCYRGREFYDNVCDLYARQMKEFSQRGEGTFSFS
ncbi:unnamed protein product, partial [Angiostrongylus costaricensis]|uniref:RGS domain-containing protein n=1 Tax=Angiostrongylus costaricensis TaxID=334426 RepID=A0A0R3PKR9_ANGCS